MILTCEISMYPLSENYARIVTDFIIKIKKYEGIRVEVNGLSTQLFGEYSVLMNVLHTELKEVFENQKAVFVLKLAAGEHTVENLPDTLK